MDKKDFKKRFDTFLGQLFETNATLGFYADFEKIGANVDSIAIKLNQLNYLVGKTDMAKAVHELWRENPSTFSVLDILIAVRKKDKKKAFDRQGHVRLIEDFFHTPEDVIEYIEDTGLGNVLRDKHITNLVDYVFGVETGLDTNARKNRSGHLMENKVARILDAAQVPYRKEVYASTLEGFDYLGKDKKRFDFVITTPVKTYVMEVNFYSGGGSKLNEVARAYSELAPKINASERYEFVWITDGVGWKDASNKLEEAFHAIPRIYNLTTIDEFIKQVKQELS